MKWGMDVTQRFIDVFEYSLAQHIILILYLFVQLFKSKEQNLLSSFNGYEYILNFSQTTDIAFKESPTINILTQIF